MILQVAESNGTITTMLSVVNLLNYTGPIPEHDVVNLCAPDSWVEEIWKKENGGSTTPRDWIKKTIETWIGLGLLVKKGDKIDVSFGKKNNSNKIDLIELQTHVRDCLLDKKNNSDENQSGSYDFSIGSSWLLAQDIWDIQFTNWASAQEVIQDQVGPDEQKNIILNDTRWNNLKEYMVFTGLGRNENGKVFIPDPTEAIKQILPDIKRDFGKTLSSKDLIGHLSQKLPVLDEGVYRVEVEKKISRGENPAWRKPEQSQVSTSLSFALVRLMKLKLIDAKNESDAVDKITLSGRNRHAWEIDSPNLPQGICSHFTIL